MGPHIFYRVEDDESSARYIDGKGILAADRNSRVNFNRKGAFLRNHLARHLDWENRLPTPFASAYCNKRVAWTEAKRRVNAGKRNVTVYKMDMHARRKGERIEYRDIQLLAERLEYDIPHKALHNSEYEYVFLHRIPQSVIVGWKVL